MASFIDYSPDEVETVYELLDNNNCNLIRTYLTKPEKLAKISEEKNGQKIKFRIKPHPKTPKEKHNYCTMNCYFTQLSQAAREQSLLKKVFA